MEDIFEYSDHSKCTITSKGKKIPLRLALKYRNQYGIHAATSIYQQYPKKDNEPMDLMDKIEQLKQKASD